MVPSVLSPGDFIRAELENRGWGQDDLARVLGRSLTRVNDLLHGKQSVSPEIAIDLAAALGSTADEWLRRESAYRLSLADGDARGVQRRARLYELAPIREMQKRGWIKTTADVDEIESEILRFFEIASIDEEPAIETVLRASTPNAALTHAHRAWCIRVRQIAKSVVVPPYREDRIERCLEKLRKLAAYSPEIRKAPGILASFGIRLIVVEPLASGTKIDGMTTWLDDHSPVIGLSLRHDRIDGFWHTLCHEMIHVRYRDRLSVDIEIAEPGEVSLSVKPPMERRADAEGAAVLIDPKELDSFIRRVGPLYSKERINQFANRIKMHPGIIVGQLQHRGEIDYSHNREMLVKVRQAITAVSLTDGWGVAIDSRVLE